MRVLRLVVMVFFFFQAEDGIRDVAVTGVQTCALPIYLRRPRIRRSCTKRSISLSVQADGVLAAISERSQFVFRRLTTRETQAGTLTTVSRMIRDRKSTRLNSSHGYISYAVFCLKKKTK